MLAASTDQSATPRGSANKAVPQKALADATAQMRQETGTSERKERDKGRGKEIRILTISIQWGPEGMH